MITELERIREESKLEKDLLEIVAILLDAISGWPTSIETLEEFRDKVKKFNGYRPVNKANIERLLTETDLTNEAWQGESLTQLLTVYKFYNENLSMTEIVDNIKQRLHLA